jgi:hypothetical protein
MVNVESIKTPENSLNDCPKERQKGNCVVCFGEYSVIQNKGKIPLYFLW